MQEFTLEQIGMQVTALQNFFDQVTLIDPLAQAEVDPATLQATGHADAVPVLNADGRGWQPILGEDTGFVFYQNIQVENRPFVLAATYFLTADLPANDREANALLRLLGQYREEMRRDYVTGVYNRAFLDSTYRKKVAAAACAGKPVSVVAARVNEYWNLLREEGAHAADCCLNTAAGILQLAAGPDQQNAVVRLEDGIFLVVSVGTPAAKLQAALHEALGESRRTFGITLSRRGEFTVSLSSADWGEAGSWDLMVALAEQRLSGC
ncbi:MAG: diguanylate cyclase domain-containing protein [Subdoligranulum sp.]